MMAAPSQSGGVQCGVKETNQAQISDKKAHLLMRF